MHFMQLHIRHVTRSTPWHTALHIGSSIGRHTPLDVSDKHCRLVDSSDERSLFARTESLFTITGHRIGVRIILLKLNSFAVEAQCYNWSSPHLPSPLTDRHERITRSIVATDEAEYRLHQSEYRVHTIANAVRGHSTNRATIRQ